MKKVVFAVLFAAMLFGTMAISHAERGDWRAEVRSRINAANYRIQRGAERGSLTQAEAWRLKQELRTILLKINQYPVTLIISQSPPSLRWEGVRGRVKLQPCDFMATTPPP